MSLPGREGVAKARELQRLRLEQNYLPERVGGTLLLGLLTASPPTSCRSSPRPPPRSVAAGTRTTTPRLDRNENENRFQGRGFPSRQRDVAIYEYSPGRSIVVDGVSAKVPAITEWKRPASEEGVSEDRIFVRSAAVAVAVPVVYPGDCRWRTLPRVRRGGGFDQFRSWAPAGFAVDARYQIHDDPSSVGSARA